MPGHGSGHDLPGRVCETTDPTTNLARKTARNPPSVSVRAASHVHHSGPPSEQQDRPIGGLHTTSTFGDKRTFSSDPRCLRFSASRLAGTRAPSRPSPGTPTEFADGGSIPEKNSLEKFQLPVEIPRIPRQPASLLVCKLRGGKTKFRPNGRPNGPVRITLRRAYPINSRPRLANTSLTNYSFAGRHHHIPRARPCSEQLSQREMFTARLKESASNKDEQLAGTARHVRRSGRTRPLFWCTVLCSSNPPQATPS